MSAYLKELFRRWSYQYTDAQDSFALFSDGFGNFSADRIRMHENIIGSYMIDIEPHDAPVTMIVGGGAAVGKTTLVNSLLKDETDRPYLVVNCDDIKTLLLEHAGLRDHAFVHRESFVVAERIIYRATTLGCNILIDTTGGGEWELLRMRIECFKSPNRRLIAHYVITGVETALARSKARAAVTGRNTPEIVIRRSYAEVIEVVPLLAESGVFDEFAIWYNHGDRPMKVVHTTDLAGTR